MTHKKVLRNSLIYTFNNLLLKAFNFLLLPLYTAFLTPQDYGVTNLLASFTHVSTYLIAFSLYSATIRFYADLKGDSQRLKEFYGTMLCFVALSGLVFLGMFLIFQKFLLAVFFQGIPFYPTVLLGLVALLGTSLYTMYQDILKGMQLAKKSAITSLSYFFLQVALNILFVAILKFGANGVLLSLVISNAVAIVWMLFDLGKHHLFCFCINKELLKEALRYSIPIIPHNLSTHIAQFVSRVFINANTSLVSVGLFGLASKFGSLADMVQNSVNMAFQPWFFEQLSKREALDTRQIVSLSNSLVWLYGIVFLGLALFSQELIALMATDAYQSSWMLVPLIVAVFAIKTPYYFYINILFYYKKAAKYIFIATVSSSLLNVFLSYFFIKAWGMFGSVAADAIAMLLRVGIVVYLANKFSKIGYSLVRFGLHFLFLLLCMVVALYPSYVQGNASVSMGACLYKIGVLIVFCIIALWANKGSIGGILAILRKRR